MHPQQRLRRKKSPSRPPDRKHRSLPAPQPDSRPANNDTHGNSKRCANNATRNSGHNSNTLNRSSSSAHKARPTGLNRNNVPSSRRSSNSKTSRRATRNNATSARSIHNSKDRNRAIPVFPAKGCLIRKVSSASFRNALITVCPAKDNRSSTASLYPANSARIQTNALRNSPANKDSLRTSSVNRSNTASRNRRATTACHTGNSLSNNPHRFKTRAHPIHNSSPASLCRANNVRRSRVLNNNSSNSSNSAPRHRRLWSLMAL